MSDNLARSPASPAWRSTLALQPGPALPPAPEPIAERRFRITPEQAARPAHRTRPRMFYAIIACAGVAAIFVVKLLLSVAVSEGAHESSSLEVANKNLTRQVQTATENLDRVRSPQYLAANAEALGMVSNSHPVYLRLSDGAVLGQPQTADASAGGQGGAQSLVPNSLISGLPLVTQQPAAPAAEPTAGKTPAAAPTGEPAAATAATPAATPAASPEPTALPTPVTH